MHLQQIKRGSRETGGPQYYFHDLSDVVKSYSNIIPIETPVPAERQSAKRHYGVHPYFTRRPANVVRKYILHYSMEGDRILDQLGGSGVAAIEAFLENKVGIQNDIKALGQKKKLRNHHYSVLINRYQNTWTKP